MGSGNFALNRAGVSALLRSQGVQARLDETARDVASKAGKGFGSEVVVGGTRARAYVFTNSREGRVRQAKDHSLERAIGGT